MPVSQQNQQKEERRISRKICVRSFLIGVFSIALAGLLEAGPDLPFLAGVFGLIGIFLFIVFIPTSFHYLSIVFDPTK